MAFVYIEHLDEALAADNAFRNTRLQAVAVEVVEAVHVELTRDEFVQERLVIVVFKNF
jgi:hypothetical protein